MLVKMSTAPSMLVPISTAGAEEVKLLGQQEHWSNAHARMQLQSATLVTGAQHRERVAPLHNAHNRIRLRLCCQTDPQAQR
jgi:hypothetical protein